MFLHVAVVGPFADNIFQMFEAAAPGRNVCVGFSRDDSPLPQLAAARVSSVHEVLEIIQSEGPWDGVTLNGLSDSEMVELAAALPPDVKCAWYVWGYESYSRALRLRRRLLKPLTRAAVHVPSPSIKAAIGRRARLLHRDVHDWLHPPFDRFDLCVTQLPDEYELLRSAGLFRRTRYAWGAVGVLEDYVDAAAPIELPGRDIQVGNSASPVLNHLDALRVISEISLCGRRVIVPLSYGDHRYRDSVASYGKSMLGSQFLPVVEFLPLPEYSALMEPCGIVVMNQMRQHALGNIINAIWRGAVVYVNDTPTYRTFHRLGVDMRLFDVSFIRDADAGFPPLSKEQIARHRKILRAHIGRDRVINETRLLLAELAR